MKRNANGGISISKAVREAIDFLPEGLCLSMLSGKPVLVNSKMNELISRLTGHTVLEGNEIWAELEKTESANGCVKLHIEHTEGIDTSNGSSLFFMYPDGSIWQFQKKIIEDSTMSLSQIRANEITGLYSMCVELHKKNTELTGLYERQKALLEEIAENNRERELLATKMKVHDSFGRCIIAAKKFLTSGGGTENRDELIGMWRETIHGMNNISPPESGVSQWEELKKVADMIGCGIETQGQLPKDTHTLSLLYSAIREALTNAVRHGGANLLRVECESAGGRFRARIYGNGSREVKDFREGGGLGNLRRQLEQEGAFMEITFEHGVVLNIDIPAEKEG